MSYDTLRSTVRDVLNQFLGDGTVTLEEHPPGAADMMTLSILKEGVVVGAYIFTAVSAGASVRIDEIDLSALSRTPLKTFNPYMVRDFELYVRKVVQRKTGAHNRVKPVAKAPVGPPKTFLDHLLADEL